VFWFPSEAKVGVIPWHGALPSETGRQVFVVKKTGYAEQRVEIDLGTGGNLKVKLQKATRRGAGATPTSGTNTAPVRRKGEPVDPFRASKAP
jgi:hypothetical protein